MCKNANTPFYNKTKKGENFLNEKKVKIKKFPHAFKVFLMILKFQIL